MLVFNEGVPRSGKSYDAFVNHVLPALKSGRKVFARLNGMEDSARRSKIAVYLGIEIEQLDALLIHVPSAQVKATFCATRDAAGEWVIPDEMKNALFVVDECHQFYVAGREGIHPSIEEFFALCGQNGMDGVIMTQWYRRLHSSIRARIERKNSFQKLTAVGLEGRYTVTRFHSEAAERFIKISTETCVYEKIYFPMYKGYADGATNTSVYKGGGTTVWKKILKYALFVVPVVIVAIFVMHSFFSGDGGLVKKDHTHVGGTAGPSALTSGATLSAAHLHDVKDAVAPVTTHGDYDMKGMPAEVAYIFALSTEGRPRLAGTITPEGGQVAGVVEWRQDQGPVLDRMSLDDIRALGVLVEVRRYGVKLRYEKQAVIVTAWPVDQSGASQQQGQGDAVATSYGSPGSVEGQGSGHGWHERETAKVYVPPEQMPTETPSDWKPSHG